MKKTFLMLSLLLPLAACSQTERGAGAGAAGGALIGGLVTRSWEGAAIGAVAGGATGALIGRASEPGKCIYRDSAGREFVERC